MLKILQARLQQYMNQEPPDVQAGFQKGRGTRDRIANICWIIDKAREFLKNIYFCFIDYVKAFDCVDHNKLWKTLKEMGVPDHLTNSWETCMQVKKQQLELCMEQLICSKLGKEYDRAVYRHLAYLTSIMQHTRLGESQAEIKIAWRNNNNFKYADDTTLMAESEEELKSLLMRVRRKVKKLA